MPHLTKTEAADFGRVCDWLFPIDVVAHPLSFYQVKMFVVRLKRKHNAFLTNGT